MLSPGGLSERELEAVDKMRKDRMPEIQREDAVRYCRGVYAEIMGNLRRNERLMKVLVLNVLRYDLSPEDYKGE